MASRSQLACPRPARSMSAPSGRGTTEGSCRQRDSSTSAGSVSASIGRNEATGLPARVIVICSPRAARSTTSPPLLRSSRMVTFALRSVHACPRSSALGPTRPSARSCSHDRRRQAVPLRSRRYTPRDRRTSLLEAPDGLQPAVIDSRRVAWPRRRDVALAVDVCLLFHQRPRCHQALEGDAVQPGSCPWPGCRARDLGQRARRGGIRGARSRPRRASAGPGRQRRVCRGARRRTRSCAASADFQLAHLSDRGGRGRAWLRCPPSRYALRHARVSAGLRQRPHRPGTHPPDTPSPSISGPDGSQSPAAQAPPKSPLTADRRAASDGPPPSRTVQTGRSYGRPLDRPDVAWTRRRPDEGLETKATA